MRLILRTGRIVLVAAQLLWLAVSLYQTAVTLLGQRKRPRTTKIATPRFAILICARNEESVIDGILTDLGAQTYPAELMEVLVVAHNCSDSTASLARRQGSAVLELKTESPGKSQAILAGLGHLQGVYDLVGVLDADSRVPQDFLETIASASPGESCLQAESLPRSDGDWLSAGYGFGRRSRNVFWWRPREELGLGTTISGSGFFARPALLQRILLGTRTLTEDLESTALLAAEGVRVRYVGGTYVEVGEPHELADSLRQRSRWARGHLGVVWHSWPRVARQALRGDMGALDTAIFLLVPTRVLTRTAVSGAFILSALRVPGALPLAPVSVALAGEWALPFVIAVRARLLPLSLSGAELAFRHGILSLLWFPVGLWALLTAAERRWDESSRTTAGKPDAIKAR
ncbi:MAG: glycosyltransferase family 2 protein [Anaerolineaceae bacterium]